MKFEHCEDCRHEVVWVATGINVWLAIYKGSLGFLSGSTALVADALHSSADVIANFVTMASLKISAKPKDASHPYGHGKIQFISSAIVGLLLIFGGIEIMRGAIEKILTGDIVPPSMIALLGSIVSIIINECIYRYQSCVGKELNSPSIMANAWDNRSDAFSSIAVLIGIIGALIGFPICDVLAAVGVSILVIKIGVELNWTAINGLMDSSPDMSELKKIYRTAMNIPAVHNVTHMKARSGGENLIVDLECAIDSSLTVKEGDQITKEIRKTIAKEVEHLDEEDLQVYLTPYTPPEPKKKGVFSFLVNKFGLWQRPEQREHAVGK